MKYKALSIVYPGGQKIASGEKTIEVRSWQPPLDFDGDFVFVENHTYLRKEGDIDLEGKAVAIARIKRVREYEPTGDFMKHLLLSLAILFAATSAFSQSEKLRFNVSPTWPMPYAEFKDGEFVGGFMFEFSNEIAKALKLTPEFIVLPRNRTEAAALEGDYDLRCHLTKEWAKNPDLFIWTEPLFEFPTIIIGNKSTPPLQKLSDLQGKEIGTVLGYQYPGLKELFKTNQLRREDTETQTATFQKVAAGRIAYAITDKIAFDYYLKTSGKRLRFAKWQLAVSSDESRCAILKKTKLDPEKIKKAIDRLRKDGTFDRIMSQYR